MIENRNIVCFASNWFYDPTSKHHVMRLLAERNDVIWVNWHGSRRPSASAADLSAAFDKLGQFISGPRRVSPRMTVLTPIVVPLPASATAARINRGLLTRQVRASLRRLPKRPVQFWSFAPDVAGLRGAFGEELFLYYCVDEFSQFSGYNVTAVREAESRMLAAADLVVTTSQTLHDAKQSQAARSVLVPHGVDVEHFARAADPQTPLPCDLRPSDAPNAAVLGFFGLIQDWVDVELLAAVADARPEWTLALIGEARTNVTALAARRNVRLLGRRPYERLPSYCRAFDVGLIPFRLNELTRAVNPIKLREYLAAGLPVASTPLPEVRRYASLVEIGDGPAGFIAACERALARRDDAARQQRRTAMQAEGWRCRVESLSDEIEAVVRNSARRTPNAAPASPMAAGARDPD